jgi:hypothetical protein
MSCPDSGAVREEHYRPGALGPLSPHGEEVDAVGMSGDMARLVLIGVRRGIGLVRADGRPWRARCRAVGALSGVRVAYRGDEWSVAGGPVGSRGMCVGTRRSAIDDGRGSAKPRVPHPQPGKPPQTRPACAPRGSRGRLLTAADGTPMRGHRRRALCASYYQPQRMSAVAWTSFTDAPKSLCSWPGAMPDVDRYDSTTP